MFFFNELICWSCSISH